MPDRSPRKQAGYTGFPRRAAFFLVLLALGALPLAACGKKANELQPPGGTAAGRDYPRVYPDPATDPKPTAP